MLVDYKWLRVFCRVHLKAVGSLGESCNSNVVEFRTSAVTVSAVSAFQSDDPNNTNGKSGMTRLIGLCLYVSKNSLCSSF